MTKEIQDENPEEENPEYVRKEYTQFHKQKKIFDRERKIAHKKKNNNKRRERIQQRQQEIKIEQLKEQGIEYDGKQRQDFVNSLKQQKNEEKARVVNAMADPDNAKVIIDCSFLKHKGQQEKKQLAMQVQLITGDQKKKVSEEDKTVPFSLHLVNLKDPEIKNELEKRNASKWVIQMHEKPLEEETENIKMNWDKAIYLSPDAELPLLDFEANSGGTSFIIGALNKNKSLENSELQCRRLPLQEFYEIRDANKELIATKELCLDQVVKILNLFKYHKQLQKEESTEQIWEKVLHEVLPQKTKQTKQQAKMENYDATRDENLVLAQQQKEENEYYRNEQY